MTNVDEVRNKLEQILNIYIPIDKRGELLIVDILKLIEDEKTKSYASGYHLRTKKRI